MEGRPTQTPQRLTDIPPHVRDWLAELEPKDIARFKKWNDFIVWAETTGRFGKAFVILALSMFGAAVLLGQGGDRVSQWWHWWRGP